tara:strand:+ start:2646 stop:3644 length:999 start_codon:yes stop_codon:yes gene_type:complete
MNSENNQQAMRQQAAKFVARLYSGELSAQEEIQIYEWCEHSAAHQQEFDNMLSIWDSSSQLYQTPKATSKPIRAYWFSGLAASVVGAVILVWFLAIPKQNTGPLYQASTHRPNHYQTTIGEISTVNLPDGSIVTLNTNSAITIDFTGSQRRVWLDKGEVYFDVAKDPNRVFSIDTGHKTIRVIGTKFNVRKSNETLKVSVSEGLVAVQSSAQPSSDQIEFDNAETLLPAGSIGAFTGTSEVVAKVTFQETLTEQQWRQGVFRFDNEPLAKVITEFNRYRLKKITLQNEKLGKLKISGVFKLKDGESILSAIEAALPVNVERYPKYIELTAKN